MTYIPTDLDNQVHELMQRVKAFDPELYVALSNAHSHHLAEVETAAVACHGRLILAAIEGTTFADEDSESMLTENDSILVQLIDGR